MSRVESMYQAHLNLLRELADWKGIPFIDVLRVLNKSYRPSLATVITKSTRQEQIKRAEQNLIDGYRIEYYEKIANACLELEETVINAVKIDAKQLARIKAKIEKVGQALKTSEVQEKNLKLGRNQGAAKNKKRAKAIKDLVIQLNSDLIKHADTWRWNLNERATYIAEKIGLATVVVEGKSYNATMANGKKYSAATIRTWITGT